MCRLLVYPCSIRLARIISNSYKSSTPSCDDSHMAVDHMPRSVCAGVYTSSASYPFVPFRLCLPYSQHYSCKMRLYIYLCFHVTIQDGASFFCFFRRPKLLRLDYHVFRRLSMIFPQDWAHSILLTEIS